MTTEDKERSTIVKSPEFEGDVEPLELLGELSVYIERLENKPDESTVRNITDRLKQLEIITMNTGESERWLASPFTLHRQVAKKTMPERLMHLIQSGKWIGDESEGGHLEACTKTELPISIEITNTAKMKMLNDEISSQLIALIGLHDTILDNLKNGIQSAGVFTKPYGIVNMNRMKAWFKDEEINGMWGIEDTLKVTNLLHVIDSTSYSVSK